MKVVLLPLWLLCLSTCDLLLSQFHFHSALYSNPSGNPLCSSAQGRVHHVPNGNLPPRYYCAFTSQEAADHFSPYCSFFSHLTGKC